MMSNHLIGKTWTLHKYARFTKDGDSSRTCPTGGDEKASSATEGQSQSQWNWKASFFSVGGGGGGGGGGGRGGRECLYCRGGECCWIYNA